MNQGEIQLFIDENINPGLGMHGGYLLIKDYDDETKVLKVEMGGGCQGCASSTVTLKLMIDRALHDEFPNLGEIQDVTAHDEGTNPFYG